MRRFAKFVLVGILNTAFGYLVFAAILQIIDYPAVALLMATVVGVLFNYFTTGRLVFYSRDYRALLPFVLAYTFVYLVNLAAIHGLIHFGIDVLLAQLFCLPWIALLSYFVNARFVFRNKS